MTLFGWAIGFGLVTASILALGAVGLTLQFGVTNFANFAYGDMMTLAIYLTWVLSGHLPFWLAVTIAALAMALIAVLLSESVLGPFVRQGAPPLILLIVTFGLSLIINNVVLAIWGASSRQLPVVPGNPINLGPFLLTPSQLVTMLFGVAAMLGIHFILTYTRLGKAMRAVSDNPDLAKVSGIPPASVTRFAWALTGVLSALSGVALAVSTAGFSPALGESFLFVLFAAVILGGVGKPYGAMLGALIIGVITEVSALFIPQYKLDVAFVVLIAALLLRPEGLLRSPGKV